MTISELNAELGNVDLFVLDQILKGRFEGKGSLLDLGSGEGRNLTYFLKNGYAVTALDQNQNALQMLRMYARTLGSKIQDVEGDVSSLPFNDRSFDVILAISILHFVADFKTVITEIHRVLNEDGICLIKSKYDDISSNSKDHLRLISQEDLDWLGTYWTFEEPIRWVQRMSHDKEVELVLRKK